MPSYKDFLQKQPDYLVLLSNLKTFIKAIRRHNKKRSQLTVADVLTFVDLMQENKLPLWDNLRIEEDENAVNLLTVHASKGLEFSKVFVIHCNQKKWQPKSHAKRIPATKNLQIFPDEDNQEDQERLFYVAVTRAKEDLYLSSNKIDLDTQKILNKLEFVQNLPENWPQETEKNQSEADSLDKEKDNQEQVPATNRLLNREKMEISLEVLLKPLNLNLEIKQWLKPILADYQLSATHLNNFLDVTNGGPQRFLEVNLLRFPQRKSPSGMYGSAMHAAIAKFYTRYKQDQSLPSLEFLWQVYQAELAETGLSVYSQEGRRSEYEEYLDKGKKHLQTYYNLYKNQFATEHLLEIDFAKQEVVLQPIADLKPARITGKIDKMILQTLPSKEEKNKLIVVDYKTGKVPKKQADTNDLKMFRYYRQLEFYKLLVENSRDWHTWQVDVGRLEFLEAENEKELQVEYLLDLEKTEKLAKLIQIVYNKIINLDLPDTSKYSSDLKGVREFIDDLLREYT